jgi:quercetin dioxygenase-like cupin family protein
VTRPGEFYLDMAGSVHTAANQTDRPARVSYVILLPKGAAVTTLMGGPSAGELPPGPKTISRSNWPGLAMAGEFELINLILEFGSGSSTPSHIHGGPGMATVLDGEMVFTTAGQPGQVIRPGQFYLDVAGSVHTATNQTASPARVSYVVVLPKGTPLTTVSGAPLAPAPAAPGMPRTGAPLVLLPLVVLALGLLGVGFGTVAHVYRARKR